MIQGHTLISPEGRPQGFVKFEPPVTWDDHVTAVAEDLRVEIAHYLEAPQARKNLQFLWLGTCKGAPVAQKIVARYGTPTLAWDCNVYQKCIHAFQNEFFRLYGPTQQEQQEGGKALRDIYIEARKIVEARWRDEVPFQSPLFLHNYSGLLCWDWTTLSEHYRSFAESTKENHIIDDLRQKIAADLHMITEPQELSRELQHSTCCRLVALIGAAPERHTNLTAVLEREQSRIWLPEEGPEKQRQPGGNTSVLIVDTKEQHGLLPGDSVKYREDPKRLTPLKVQSILSPKQFTIEVDTSVLFPDYVENGEEESQQPRYEKIAEMPISVYSAAYLALLKEAHRPDSSFRFAVLLGPETEQWAKDLAVHGVSSVAWSGQVGNVVAASRFVLRLTDCTVKVVSQHGLTLEEMRATFKDQFNELANVSCFEDHAELSSGGIERGREKYREKERESVSE